MKNPKKNLILSKLKIAKLTKTSHIKGGDSTLGDDCDPARSYLILHCPKPPTNGNGNGNG